MQRWAGRVALVTGASVGIGAATAESLVKSGMTVVGCARNVAQIEDLSKKLEGEKGKLHAVRCDITKEEDILAMFEVIRRDHGRLDVCINNAGVGHCAPLLSGDTQQWRNMINVNLLGLCICSREAYKMMKETKVDDGYIILINSMGGHRTLPDKNFTFYSATKFAVRSICEGLRLELRDENSKIRVSEISPGVVETDFFARMQGDAATKKLHSTLMPRRSQPLQTEDIVASLEYLLTAPPHVQIDDILLRPPDQKF